MKRTLLTGSLLLALISNDGCRRDEMVNGALAEVNSFTSEIVERVEAAKDPSAGIDDAESYFRSRKQELGAKLAELKSVRSDQVSEETKQKLAEKLLEDSSRMANLQIKYVGQSLNDPVFDAKLDKLVKDYQAWLSE
jgi:hypothetical protein